MLKKQILLKNFGQIVEKAHIRARKFGKNLRIIFQDEARFGRINDQKRCWAPPKTRPIIGKQIVREYTYLYGTICPQDGKTDFLILLFMDANCMNLFIKEVSERYKNDCILMVCDGAPCHKEGVIDMPKNMDFLKLPLYSPQLNPVENLWGEMREKFFHNQVFESMKAVENLLVKASNFYENNPQITRKIAAWNWIIDAT